MYHPLKSLIRPNNVPFIIQNRIWNFKFPKEHPLYLAILSCEADQFIDNHKMMYDQMRDGKAED